MDYILGRGVKQRRNQAYHLGFSGRIECISLCEIEKTGRLIFYCPPKYVNFNICEPVRLQGDKTVKLLVL